MWDMMLQILGAILALIVVLLLAWLLLRWMNKRVPGMGTGSAKMIKVLDRVNVGRTTVVLMRVESKVLLVAMSEHSIQKLQEFDDPNGDIAPTISSVPSFSDTLKDVTKRMKFGGGDKDKGEKL